MTLVVSQTPRRRRTRTLFDGTYSPSKCRWWHETIPGALWDLSAYGHLDVLNAMINGGRSVDDTEALDWCYRRVVDEGARSGSGRWCVCLTEDAPSAGEARGSIGGDGIAALVAVRADLEHAVDELPIGWATTSDLYQIQGRSALYHARFREFKRGHRIRSVDRELEPIDPETRRPMSRQLAWYWQSWVLSCQPDGDGIAWRWPRSPAALAA